MKWNECFHTNNNNNALKLYELPLNNWKHEFIINSTKQQIIDRILSVSVIALQSNHVKLSVASEIDYLLRTHKETKHIKDDKYPLAYTTDIYWTQTKPNQTKRNE